MFYFIFQNVILQKTLEHHFVNVYFISKVFKGFLEIKVLENEGRHLWPFSYLRFRKCRSRVWANLKLVGGP